MAKKRMFSSDIVRSDLFLDMPISSQLLYFHFGMIADDDGIVASVRRELSYLSCGNVDDLKVLSDKRLIDFTDDGKIIFIVDWLTNNLLRADRYSESIHLSAKKEFFEKGYQFKSVAKLPTGIPSDNQPAAPELVKGLDIGLDIELVKLVKQIEKLICKKFNSTNSTDLSQLVKDFGVTEVCLKLTEILDRGKRFDKDSIKGYLNYLRTALRDDVKVGQVPEWVNQKFNGKVSRKEMDALDKRFEKLNQIK